jgi:hypothetical protein
MASTFSALLLEFWHSLVTSERGDGSSYVHLADAASPWISSAVYRMHDGELPNDARYLIARKVSDSLLYCETAEDAIEALPEIADSLSVISTTDLLSFYREHVSRLSLPEDYREEFGDDPGASTASRLHLGYWLAIYRAGEILISAITEELAR